jgi:mono/diheme cytochrome c family protein
MPASPLVVAAAATVLLAFAGPRSHAQEGPSGGRDAYAAGGCATCHGDDGRGTATGPSVATGELSLPEFVAYVREPTGTMRPYRADVLSEPDLADIYAYLTRNDGKDELAGRLDAGASLYRRTGCYECHSNEAQGGAQGPRLGPSPVTFARFSWYVRHPSGSMPPYTEEVLSDQDLADIYAFVEARPEPPPLESIPLLPPPPR